MDELKEILIVIGAFLGTVVFFQNFIKPILNYNKTKWDSLNKEIDDIDFENIAVCLWHSHAIDPRPMERLQVFIHNIERDAEQLRFKTIFSDKFGEKFKRIHKLYIQWRKLIQVPYWEPRRAPSGETAWMLNKDVFYRRYNKTGKEEYRPKGDKDYRKHMEKAYDLVEEMRKEFREISVLADREVHEFLLPWKWFWR